MPSSKAAKIGSNLRVDSFRKNRWRCPSVPTPKSKDRVLRITKKTESFSFLELDDYADAAVAAFKVSALEVSMLLMVLGQSNRN